MGFIKRRGGSKYRGRVIQSEGNLRKSKLCIPWWDEKKQSLKGKKKKERGRRKPCLRKIGGGEDVKIPISVKRNGGSNPCVEQGKI